MARLAVKFFVHFFHLIVGHMRVNLRRRNRGMTKQGLHGSDISSREQQVRGKRMAQGMRGDVLGNTSFFCIALDDSLHGSRSKSAFVCVRSVMGDK